MKTLKNPIILAWTVCIAVLFFAPMAYISAALDDWGWMGVRAVGFICLMAIFYFTHSIETDDVGIISFGGNPIEKVGPGYVYTIPLILSLKKTKWRMQYNFNPEKHELTEKSLTCNLRPIQFKSRASSTDPYEQQVTTTPWLTLSTAVEDAKMFFKNAHNHTGAADLICEFVNAALLKATHDMTLRDFINNLSKIEKDINEALEENNTLQALGLAIFGAGRHKGIRILNAGVPNEVVLAEKAAMSAKASVATARAEGEAAQEKALGEADAIRKKGTAEAEVAGLKEQKLQQARTEGFGTRVAALAKENVTPDVAAAAASQEAMAGAIAANDTLLVANLGGGPSVGGMLLGMNLTEEKKRKEEAEKK